MKQKIKDTALGWIDTQQELIINLHKKAWEFAEIGLQEYKTSKMLADVLEENGFEVLRGIAGIPTAFVATFGTGGPVIGVMAELDALPGLSQAISSERQPIIEVSPRN